MENTKIEWCDSSWNPVTGCYNNCPYCYARRIANRLKGCDNCPSGIHPSLSRIIELSHRLQATSKDGKKRAAAYPFGFTPTLHEYRLDDPQKKGFGKTVFVCSMADMFGPWVPDEWIKRVFQSCLDAPGHRYLFLTKNPIRYIELAEAGILPERDDFWYGSTVTGPEAPAFYGGGYKTFASIEPILKPFDAPGDLGISVMVWAPTLLILVTRRTKRSIWLSISRSFSRYSFSRSFTAATSYRFSSMSEALSPHSPLAG